MNRRAFFGATVVGGVASFVPLGMGHLYKAKTELVAVSGRRVSVVKGDVGELFYAKICGDGKSVEIYLDDVKQKYCITADEEQGIVVRLVETENGNIAINKSTNEILQETIKGRVRIEIV